MLHHHGGAAYTAAVVGKIAVRTGGGRIGDMFIVELIVKMHSRKPPFLQRGTSKNPFPVLKFAIQLRQNEIRAANRNPVRIVYTQGIPVPRRHGQQGDAPPSGNPPHSTDAGGLLLRW